MKNTLYIVVLFTFFQCSTKKNLDSNYKAEIAQHRVEYKAAFVNEDHSPLDKEDLKHLDFYEADQNYVCNCKVNLTPEEEPFEVDTYSGMKKDYIKYANAVCSLNGKEVKLALYKILRLQAIPGYKDLLFLPFMDYTNGETTYGGGRYIDLSQKDITDGKLIIDFNKCYNPYCAFSDGYNCPIPPLENHLELAIEAGEKVYKGAKKHRK